MADVIPFARAPVAEGEDEPTTLALLQEYVRKLESGELKMPTGIFIATVVDNGPVDEFPYFTTGLNKLEEIGLLALFMRELT